MLPLFPLSQPLFPDSILPLRIFEVRYLHLIRQCHRDGKPFGIVALSQGTEVQVPGELEVFHDIGCLAHLTQVKEVQAGLLAVQCVGGDRFRVLSKRRESAGLWTAEVEMLAPDIPTDIPPDLQPLANKLGALIADAQKQGVEQRLPVTRPYRLDECGWVANQWAHLLNMDASTKVRILDEDDPLARLTIIKTLIDLPGPDQA